MQNGDCRSAEWLKLVILHSSFLILHLGQPALQADPSRCESGHGCHCPQSVRECARLLAKQEDRGVSPRGGTTLMVIMM